MLVWIRSELDLLKIYETITSLDDDVIQSLWRFVFVVALEFYPAIASRSIEPIAQDFEALAILVNVAGCCDSGVLNILSHGGRMFHYRKCCEKTRVRCWQQRMNRK